MTTVCSNANLNRSGSALGLQDFICGSTDGKRVADTVEAILGAVWLDSGCNMTKCKDVVDAMGLLTREQKFERELDIEGFVALEEKDVLLLPAKKRPSPTSEESTQPLKRLATVPASKI